MKKTFRILLSLMLGVSGSLIFSGVQAQNNTFYNTPQAPNFDFEVWDDPEPWGWNSSSCFEAGHSPSQWKRNQSVWVSNDVRPGGTGMYSAYIKVTQSSWYHYQAPFGTTSRVMMGTLTTGTLYYYDSKENSKSCIYTNTGDGSRRWAFTGRPDSVVFWVKKGSNEGRPADFTMYLHRDEKFADCNPNGYNTASFAAVTNDISYKPTTPIASASCKITNTEWQRISLPITYQSQENPAYLLLSFTAGNNFREVMADDELWVDDVLLVYNPILSIDTVSPLQVAHHGSQGITLNVPYTFYSGTQDPLNPAAQNALRVYISDENGNFDNKKLLATANVNGGDNIKHQGYIKITLPASIIDSDKYKIQIEASNYPLQSNIIELNIYKQWYLTINQAQEYGTTNAVNRQLCKNGSLQTAIATVNNAECRFLRWEEGGRTVVGAGAEYSFNISQDRNLTAVFDTTFTLRFAESVGASGYFENNNLTELTLLNGETAQLRADIEEGYRFRGFYFAPVTWTVSRPSYDYTALRGGTIYVLTDSIPYEYEFSVYPDAKLGTASGSGIYKHFGTVTASAEAKQPAQYSRFLHWEDLNGNVVGNEPVLRFENIDKGGSYRAVFEETFYHVRLSVNDPLDGYALQCSQRKADSSYSAFDRTDISLQAVPARGIGFRHWEVSKNGVFDGIVEDNPYNLTQNSHLDADYALHAIFDTLTYNLNVSAQNGYTEGTGTYMYGKDVVLRATPNKGYHFAGWQSGSLLLGTADTLVVRILRDSIIRAVFEPNEYALRISSNNAELGSVDLPSGLYPYGQALSLNAMPALGAEFRYWVIDGDTLSSTKPSHTFTVSDSCTVLAIFSHARSNVRLYASNSLYGRVSGAGIYEWHSPVQMLAEAFMGYAFKGWQTQQGELIPDNRIEIPQIEGDTVLTALFEPVTFQVRLQADGHGDVRVGEVADNLSERRFDYMDYAVIQAIPHSGYEFAGWYDKAGHLCSTYPQEGFSVERDTSLTARFVEKHYTVSLFVRPLEAGALHGQGRYTGGETATISVDTSDGYIFLGWYEADTLFESKSRFSIELTSDRYFVARFRENKYMIEVKADDASRVDSLYGEGEYQYAYNANVYVYSKKGYEVAAWVNREGDTVSRLNPYLHDVLGDETLTAIMRPAKLKASYGIKPEDAGRVRAGEVFYGVPASATANPAYGYRFSHWENPQGETIGNQATLNFSAVTDTLLVAVFDSLVFEISGVPQNPLRGNVVGSGSYKYLSSCTLSISHDLRYDFVGWYNQEGKLLSLQHTWTFTVTEPLDVIAYFEPLPVLTNLSVEPENGGTIQYQGEQLQGEVKVLYEDSLRFEAIPAPGMKFLKWRKVDPTGMQEGEWTDRNHVFLPQGGSFVTAVFDTVDYEISLAVEPLGCGSVQGAGSYNYGDRAELRAQASEHYRFYAYKTGDKVLSYDSAYALRVDSAMEVRAVFRPVSYEIMVVSSDWNQGGVVGMGGYPYGTDALVEAFIWNDSVEFAYWSHELTGKDTVSFDARMLHPVRGEEILIAFFKPASRFLQIETEGKGRVSGEDVYTYGDMATLVAEAAPGYHFAVWKERGLEIGYEAEISVSMWQNHDMVAVFEPDTFQLRLISELEEVEVFGAGGYANESEVNIWTGGTPAGYRFLAWKNEAGQTVSTEPGFVLPLTQDTVLYAQWQQEYYHISLQSEGEGEVSGDGEYEFGAKALLVASPAEGYRLQAWYHGKNLFSQKDTLRFATLADLVLTAVFEKDLIPAEPFVNREDGGEISVQEESETSATVHLQANPKADFHFAYWSVGDSIVGTQAQIDVPRETASSVVAHFMPDTYYVILHSTTPEGLSSLSGAGSFHKDGSTKLKVSVRKGYEFIGWFEEGSDTPISVQLEDTLTVTRPMRLDARTRKTTKQ